MPAPAAPGASPAAISRGQPVPGLTKAGVVTILIGLLADVSEHSFVSHAHEAVVSGFPVGEHAVHLVVFIGMVLVLVGIVADGTRSRTPARPARKGVS